ncbi:MAG TPA: helix-turn-helix transcriptional regulator [Luteibacter sp.]|uniref:helix-turn-helix domain-containing protein n=1 Tax=Luteibacter sp. TaxID=1886636 RepID=UPI002C943F5C|nr:helix-turn-helix transcriptional regulator [Luteibacter sp.]HVI55250.1 helix-turn-helix transcriptional regulator [Luteibacter sp.]
MTRDDTTLTHSSGNVFADLGFSEPEASVHKMRSELMIAIEKMIDDKHLSQTEAAQVLKVSQSRVSDLRRGKVEKFSLDMLVTFAARMGNKVRLTLA